MSLPCDICGQQTWREHAHKSVRDALANLELKNYNLRSTLLALVEAAERLCAPVVWETWLTEPTTSHVAHSDLITLADATRLARDAVKP